MDLVPLGMVIVTHCFDYSGNPSTPAFSRDEFYQFKENRKFCVNLKANLNCLCFPIEIQLLILSVREIVLVLSPY